jgi:prepilin-type N-terminal cleavage/methylation domain-containing protein
MIPPLARNISNIKTLQQGYSLIEISVVIFIFVILFGLGIGNYREYSRRSAFNGTLEQIVSDLHLTQEYSLSAKKPGGCDVLESYQFRRSNDHTYVIEADCNNANFTEKTIDLGSMLQIGFVNPFRPVPQHTVQFYVLGRGTNADSVMSADNIIKLGVQHTEYGFATNIAVTLNGDIYIED